jgi:hypothetical protein
MMVLNWSSKVEFVYVSQGGNQHNMMEGFHRVRQGNDNNDHMRAFGDSYELLNGFDRKGRIQIHDDDIDEREQIVSDHHPQLL